MPVSMDWQGQLYYNFTTQEWGSGVTIGIWAIKAQQKEKQFTHSMTYIEIQ